VIGETGDMYVQYGERNVTFEDDTTVVCMTIVSVGVIR